MSEENQLLWLSRKLKYKPIGFPLTGGETVRHPDIKTRAGIPFMSQGEREYQRHPLHSSLLSYLVFHIFPQGGFKVMSTCRWSGTFLWSVTFHPAPPSSYRRYTTLHNDKYNQWEKSGGQCCCWLLVSCYCLASREISCCLKLTSQRYRSANILISSSQQQRVCLTFLTIYPFIYNQIFNFCKIQNDLSLPCISKLNSYPSLIWSGQRTGPVVSQTIITDFIQPQISFQSSDLIHLTIWPAIV